MDIMQKVLHDYAEGASARALLDRLEARIALEAMPPTDRFAVPEPPQVRSEWMPARPGPWGYLSCDYDERRPKSYRGIVLDFTDALGHDHRWRFMSGCYETDMTRARRFLVGLGCRYGQSSSVSDYVIDRNRAERPYADD